MAFLLSSNAIVKINYSTKGSKEGIFGVFLTYFITELQSKHTFQKSWWILQLLLYPHMYAGTQELNRFGSALLYRSAMTGSDPEASTGDKMFRVLGERFIPTR